MASEREFQQKVRQLGTLVGELDQTPGAGSKVAARDLVQLLMEVHGTGLERIMELVFESGAHGEAMIAKLGDDPIVRNLLLLYSLHPDDLETRVSTALDTIGKRLRKFDGKVELVSMREGSVELRLHSSRRPHGAAARDMRALAEEEIYNLAPDVTSLTILGPEDEVTSGFVSLESLLNRPAAIRVARADGAE